MKSYVHLPNYTTNDKDTQNPLLRHGDNISTSRKRKNCYEL